MKHITRIAWIAALLISEVALAADGPKHCSSAAHLPNETWAQDCDCSAGINDKYKTRTPTGMKFVAACSYSRLEDGTEQGVYFFSGSFTATGVIRYQDDQSGSDLDLSFSSKPWGEFKIGYKLQDAVIKALGAPKYSEQTPCWEAEATVKVTQLVLIFGSDTEGDGNWPRDFNIVSVGKFTPCKSQR